MTNEHCSAENRIYDIRIDRVTRGGVDVEISSCFVPSRKQTDRQTTGAMG